MAVTTALRVAHVLAVVTIFLFAYGGFIYGFVPDWLPTRIKTALEIDSPVAGRYQAWRNSTKIGVHTHYRWNLFNITNAPAVIDDGALPEIADIGPFVFEYVKWRPEDSVAWLPNGTLRYYNKYYYRFLPEESAPLTLDMNITSVNMGLLALIRHGVTSTGMARAVEDALAQTGEQIISTRPARDWLYGYYDETMLLINNTYCNDAFAGNITYWMLCQIAFKLGVEQVPTFAAINANDDPSGPLPMNEIYTGAAASSKQPPPPAKSMLSNTMWEGRRKLDGWFSDDAYLINGTDGASYHPGLEEGESITAFVGSLHRSITLCYEGKADIEGLHTYFYGLCDSEKQPLSINPWNKGFNMTERGIMPTPPTLMLPYFNSEPYFNDDDGSRCLVQLPSPAPALEYLRTRVYVEPMSGQTVKARKAMQVNVDFRPYIMDGDTKPCSITTGLNSTYLPVAWMNEYMTLSDAFADVLFDRVILPKDALFGSAAAAFVLAGVSLITVVVLCVREAKKRVEGGSDITHGIASGAVDDSIQQRVGLVSKDERSYSSSA